MLAGAMLQLLNPAAQFFGIYFGEFGSIRNTGCCKHLSITPGETSDANQ